MPSGLDMENTSMTTIPTPKTRQNDVANRIFLLATKRLSSRPPLRVSSFFAAIPGFALPGVGLLWFCSKDLLMVRSRDMPQTRTARSTTEHMHTKAAHATMVAVCGYLATDKIVPATAPRHTTQRVACCPAGRSSAFDIAMISGVSRISRGSFLANVHAD